MAVSSKPIRERYSRKLLYLYEVEEALEEGRETDNLEIQHKKGNRIVVSLPEETFLYPESDKAEDILNIVKEKIKEIEEILKEFEKIRLNAYA